MFEEMVEGWQRQQTSRFLQQKGTIEPRVRLVRRFAEFTNQYPWQWTPAELEAFTAHLISQKHPAVHSTIRSYHGALRMFCEFLTDGRYGRLTECEQRFGQVPMQIAHEWNAVEHVAEYEGQRWDAQHGAARMGTHHTRIRRAQRKLSSQKPKGRV